MAAPAPYNGIFTSPEQRDEIRAAWERTRPKGYHVTYIKCGEYGDVTKIQEEVAELLDALNQKNKIMALVELTDLIGAIKGFLVKNYPGFSLEDLVTMANATERAFQDGTRK